MRMLGRITFGLLLILALAVVVGFVTERVIRAQAAERFPMPGELVDVGGHNLHYLEMGEGDITVVFETGLDITGHVEWHTVQEAVSQFAKTVSYDRAGLMFSERGERPKTGEAMAVELRTMLENGGHEPPYVIVGHSFAGITLRPFIDQYSEDIVGIMLIDVAHPEEPERFSVLDLPPPESNYPPTWVIELAFSTGLTRVILEDTYGDLDSTHYMNQIADAYFYRSWQAAIEEDLLARDMAEEANQVQSFGDIPLVVITGSKPGRYAWVGDLEEEFEAISIGLQEELLDLSTDSKWVLAENSYHFVQIEEPELVISEIEALVRRLEETPVE